MNVGIFGGTFDPVHRGHLAVARAAQKAFRLARIYFVPADLPPHKRRAPITPYPHRYAMLALALRDEPGFIPSLIEARDGSREGAPGLPGAGRPGKDRPNYTIDTVRRFRRLLPARDRLFFIIGIDAFREFDTWYKPRELMEEIEFIVVSRPGFTIVEGKFFAERSGAASLDVANGRIHVLRGVAEDVSSTALRASLAHGKVARGFLDDAVADYIRKEHLYEARNKGRGTKDL